MEILISIRTFGFCRRARVKVIEIIEHEGLFFGLHRPPGKDVYANTMWHVSDITTGMLVCHGSNKEKTLKKAQFLIGKRVQNIRDNQLTFFKLTSFLDLKKE